MARRVLPARLVRFSNKIFQHDFFGNILRIFLGTVLGQASSVLAAPILTRLYSPAEFGTLGVFSALLYTFSSIAALRYEMAFTLVEETRDILNLAVVCAGALGLTTLAIALATYLMPASLYHTLSLGAVYDYRYILPIGFAMIGAYQIFSFVATRTGDFRTIARTRMLQVTGPISQILMGLAHWGGFGLALGFVLGQSAGTTMLASRTILNRATPWREVTLAGCVAIAHRFRKFPMISSWSALINALGTSQLLLIFLSVFYAGDPAGFVFLTDRVIARPLVIVSTSILQVYLGEAGRNVRSDPAKLRARFRQLTLIQLVIVAVWIGGMNIAVSYFFVPLFGERWAAAVPYIRMMSIVYVPQFVLQAVIHTLLVLERQMLSAIWDASRLTAVTLVLFVSWHEGASAQSVVLGYAICQGIAFLILYGLIYRSINKVQPA